VGVVAPQSHTDRFLVVQLAAVVVTPAKAAAVPVVLVLAPARSPRVQMLAVCQAALAAAVPLLAAGVVVPALEAEKNFDPVVRLTDLGFRKDRR